MGFGAVDRPRYPKGYRVLDHHRLGAHLSRRGDHVLRSGNGGQGVTSDTAGTNASPANAGTNACPTIAESVSTIAKSISFWDLLNDSQPEQ